LQSTSANSLLAMACSSTLSLVDANAINAVPLLTLFSLISDTER